MDLIIFFVIAFVSVMVVMTVMAVFRGFCMQLHVSALRDNRPERPHRLPKILTLNGDRRINLSREQWAWLLEIPNLHSQPVKVHLPGGGYALAAKTKAE